MHCRVGCGQDTYLIAQFKHIAKRRSKERALLAVTHSIIIAVYYILQDDLEYRELGGD